MNNRVFNTIERAINDFGLEVDMSDSLQDIFDHATNVIENSLEFDYISECERNRRWTHISWNDGNGFDLEADGEFISSDERHNLYYRYENGKYRKIEWYEQTDNDFVLVYDVIDSNGLRVGLVAKC